MSGTKVSTEVSAFLRFVFAFSLTLYLIWCPFTRFIQYEFKALACLLFQTLDMRVAPNQTLPGVRPEMEGVGVSQPKDDFFVQLKKK